MLEKSFNGLNDQINTADPVERQDTGQEKTQPEATIEGLGLSNDCQQDEELVIPEFPSDTLDENSAIKDKVVPETLTEPTEPELLSDSDSQPADAGQTDTNTPEKSNIDILDSLLQQIGEISFTPSENGRIGHNSYYIGSIDNILETARLNQWDIGMKNEAPHVYTGQFWQRVEEQLCRHFFQEAGVRQGIPHNVIKDHLFVDKQVKQFASEARFPILSTNGTPKINLRNGTLHFTPDGIELKPFDKQDGLTYQLHYDFDPMATAPLFKQFLDRVLPDAAIQKLVFQYIGYVFLRSMRLEKVLFFHGGGANGKSVLLNIVRALVGVGQCCEYSLEGITSEAYQRAEVGNYLLNVCTEISARMGTAYFKKIASREPLDARYPYGKPFTVWEYATSIFAMNELPKDVEQTDAFFRRFIVIPFDVRIPDNEQDPDLAKKIIASEMSGVLNLVIEGMLSLIREGKFDIPESVQKAVEKFRQDSDSVLSYLVEDGCQISHEQWIPLNDLYQAYKERCKDDGRIVVSKITFSQRLKSLGYTVEKRGHNKKTMVNTDTADGRLARRCKEQEKAQARARARARAEGNIPI